jgi:hypothetical protein
MILLISPHPVSAMPCGPPMPLLQSPPGSRRDRTTEPTQYNSRASNSLIAPIGADQTSHHRFQISEQIGWGISNGRRRQPVEIRSDLFHRREKTGLRKDEPRLNLCSRARDRGRAFGRGSMRRWAVILIPGCPQHLQKPRRFCPQASGPGKCGHEAGAPAPRST